MQKKDSLLQRSEIVETEVENQPWKIVRQYRTHPDVTHLAELLYATERVHEDEQVMEGAIATCLDVLEKNGTPLSRERLLEGMNANFSPETN